MRAPIYTHHSVQLALVRVAVDLQQRSLSHVEYEAARQQGEPHWTTVVRYFGTWNNAVSSIGLNPLPAWRWEVAA